MPPNIRLHSHIIALRGIYHHFIQDNFLFVRWSLWLLLRLPVFYPFLPHSTSSTQLLLIHYFSPLVLDWHGYAPPAFLNFDNVDTLAIWRDSLILKTSSRPRPPATMALELRISFEEAVKCTHSFSLFEDGEEWECFQSTCWIFD